MQNHRIIWIGKYLLVRRLPRSTSTHPLNTSTTGWTVLVPDNSFSEDFFPNTKPVCPLACPDDIYNKLPRTHLYVPLKISVETMSRSLCFTEKKHAVKDLYGKVPKGMHL